MDANKAFGYVDTMQKVCMEKGSWITLDEWLDEHEVEQKRYYNWIRKQVGDWTAGPYWE